MAIGSLPGEVIRSAIPVAGRRQAEFFCQLDYCAPPEVESTKSAFRGLLMLRLGNFRNVSDQGKKEAINHDLQHFDFAAQRLSGLLAATAETLNDAPFALP
jgi:hypothetical protein